MPRHRFAIALTGAGLLVLTASWWPGGVGAWDSAAGNPTHPTHTYLTEWAIDALRDQTPELQVYREAIIDGANAELHELPIRSSEKKLGKKYDLDLEAMRVRHRGTNAGCDDLEGWWTDGLSAYRQGKKWQAYFLLGVVLHMTQDMGVPAHANGVYHQGNLKEFDNFEFLAALNWKPDFGNLNRADPAFAEPWRYYEFSRSWAHDDAPEYKDRDTFSKFWISASDREKRLVRNRQGRTSHVTKWCLSAAIKVFPVAGRLGP